MSGPAPAKGAPRHGAPVRLQGLQKAYGEMHAVRDVTLSVAAGEFVTLLGPSGSGKTTTLMMIAGFVPATGGGVSSSTTARWSACRRSGASSAWCSRATHCFRT